MTAVFPVITLSPRDYDAVLFDLDGVLTRTESVHANLQQALLISFFVLFPVMFLSGTVVPIESMPRPLQYVSLASPVRYYMEIALGIFLKGVGWNVLWPQFLALLAIGSGLAGWGLIRLKSRLYV